MTTKFNPGEEVLLLAKVTQIAIDGTETNQAVRYNVECTAGTGEAYTFWIDEDRIVTRAF